MMSAKYYLRVCKYCDKVFDSETKHSKVCNKCKEYKRKEKVVNTLFN
jgi:hypothetical protein